MVCNGGNSIFEARMRSAACACVEEREQRSTGQTPSQSQRHGAASVDQTKGTRQAWHMSFAP